MMRLEGRRPARAGRRRRGRCRPSVPAVLLELVERARRRRSASMPSTVRAEHLEQPAVGVQREALVVAAARPGRCTDSSLRPTLRTVSIIPGIENFAPERTATSSGSSASPSRRPIASSSAARCSSTSSARPSGSSPGLEVGAAGLGGDREARAAPGARGWSSRRGWRPCRRAGPSGPCCPRRSRRRRCSSGDLGPRNVPSGRGYRRLSARTPCTPTGRRRDRAAPPRSGGR